MMTSSTPGISVISDPVLPIARYVREFSATPAQIIKAHIDPDIFVQWIGPDGTETKITEWNAKTGGNYRYSNIADGESYNFYGSFHVITEDRIVQTFTFEGFPEAVSLDTVRVTDLGNGKTLLEAETLLDSIESRDAMVQSGMETGINDGYIKLDQLIADGSV